MTVGQLLAQDALYEVLGVQSALARVVLGVAAIAAFAASLMLLAIDWRGSAARHAEAADRWSEVVQAFRRYKREADEWPPEHAEALHNAYWEASRNSVAIPDGAFNRLKAGYLLKVAVSTRAQANPGAPRLLLWLLVRLSGTAGAIRSEVQQSREGVGRDDNSNDRGSSS